MNAQLSDITTTASVLGASGYSGAELTRLLLSHPNICVQHLYAHASAGNKVSAIYPNLDTNLTYESFSTASALDSDFYFLALPHGEALKIIPALLDAGKFVIDLSGDFRLRDAALHESYYKQSKPETASLQYGLPELFASEIAASKAVSNPGCYATCITLALAPLAAPAFGKCNQVKFVAVTAMSGLTGAGKSASVELSFSEMSENMRAYKVGTHQHTPEILQTLHTFSEGAFITDTAFLFTPVVVPMKRGIYAVLTMELAEPLNKDAALALYTGFYSDAAFVRVKENMPEVRHVQHTNFCDIFIAHAEKTSLVVIAALDNLLKGAAGQAVQNMNLMLGLDEHTALAPTPRRALHRPALKTAPPPRPLTQPTLS